MTEQHRPGPQLRATPTLLAQVAASAKSVRELEHEYKVKRMRAMRERDEALSRAAANGASLTDLVEASSLSRPRVKQIVIEDKWR